MRARYVKNRQRHGESASKNEAESLTPPRQCQFTSPSQVENEMRFSQRCSRVRYTQIDILEVADTCYPDRLLIVAATRSADCRKKHLTERCIGTKKKAQARSDGNDTLCGKFVMQTHTAFQNFGIIGVTVRRTLRSSQQVCCKRNAQAARSGRATAGGRRVLSRSPEREAHRELGGEETPPLRLPKLGQHRSAPFRETRPVKL